MVISLLVVQLVDSWAGGKVALVFIGIGIVAYLIWNIFIASKLPKYIKANKIHYEKRTIIASLGASIATLVIYTYLMFLAVMPSLEFQVIEQVNDTLEKNYYNPSECIAVSFDKEIKDGVYKCTAYLENGEELKVNFTDSLFESKIYIHPR